MIPLITADNLSKAYGEQVLFTEASFRINPGERIGLVGRNGYGKTTLLTTWLQNRDLAAAWFSISEGDNDPSRFISYLVAAVETLPVDLELPSFGERPIRDEDLKNSFLIPIINQIGRCPKQTLFIFDDYHLIQNQAVHDQVGFLVENLPPQAHVYIATRADPPLAVARLPPGIRRALSREAPWMPGRQ